MENRDTVSKRKNIKLASLWEEIVYLAKLMRSILLYHYRYDEATDNANWRNIIITSAIGTVFSAIATQIILMIFRSYSLGGLVTMKYGYAVVHNKYFILPFNPGVMIVDMLFSLIIGFAVMLALAYLTGICLQLWFGEEHDKRQVLGFVQAVIIVKSLFLIPLEYSLYTGENMGIYSEMPARLFTVYVSDWFPEYIFFLLMFLSIALPIYSYFVLYRFLRPFKTQVKFFWMRFALIVVILRGLSVIFWQQIRVFLTPMYDYLLSYAI